MMLVLVNSMDQTCSVREALVLPLLHTALYLHNPLYATLVTHEQDSVFHCQF